MLNTQSITPGALLACLSTLYDLRLPAYLAGSPGIGKSMLVNQFCKERGLQCITLLLSQLEPGDVRGLPYLNQASGRTEWLLPEFYPSEGQGLLFLDELANAEPRVQVAAYQLLLDRKVGNYTLPDGWACIAAGNQLEDNAHVHELSAALVDRMVWFHVVCSASDWLDWATKASLAPEVLTFIQLKPDFLQGVQGQAQGDSLLTPTPRSWERVSRIVKREKNKAVREYLVSGVVGQSAAIEFFHVLEEVAQLPAMKDLFALVEKGKPIPYPKTISGLYGLAYSATAYVSDKATLLTCQKLFSQLDTLEDNDLPGKELKTLAMQLLLQRASTLNLLLETVQSDYYRNEYRAEAKEYATL